MPGTVLGAEDATADNREVRAGAGVQADNKPTRSHWLIVSAVETDSEGVWQSDRVAILDRVVGGSFSEEIAFGLRFELQEGSHHTKTWRKDTAEGGSREGPQGRHELVQGRERQPALLKQRERCRVRGKEVSGNRQRRGWRAAQGPGHRA